MSVHAFVNKATQRQSAAVGLSLSEGESRASPVPKIEPE